MEGLDFLPKGEGIDPTKSQNGGSDEDKKGEVVDTSEAMKGVGVEGEGLGEENGEAFTNQYSFEEGDGYNVEVCLSQPSQSSPSPKGSSSEGKKGKGGVRQWFRSGDLSEELERGPHEELGRVEIGNRDRSSTNEKST